MKRIRCPIHNHITLDDRTLSFVDLPVFQRLRRIKQLGMAYTVYPGAHHSRFEHSLGVYHLGYVVSELIGLPVDDRSQICMAALLHDIGHGPFSHIMESVTGDSHEARSSYMVREGQLADMLRDSGLRPDTISDIILGHSSYSPILSSEIDIDRMDYLLRDAHYTGVSTGLDAGRLTAVMELQDDNLVFREAGLGAVEALLIARFTMYPYVYYHHTARAAERMLTRSIHLFMKDAKIQDHELWAMDDIALQSMLRSSEDVSRGLVEMIDARRLYKRGWEVPLSQLMKQIVQDDHLPQTLDHLKRRLDRKKVAVIEEQIAAIIDVEPEKVILDCPFPPSMEGREILVRTRGDEIVPARSISRLISNLDIAQLDHWKFRVFVPPEIRRTAAEKLGPKMLQFFSPNDHSWFSS